MFWSIPGVLASVLLPSVLGAQDLGDVLSREPRLTGAVVDLLETPPLPAVSVSPTRRHALFVEERGLLPLRSLAEPALEIGLLRVNPRTYGPHAPLGYVGLRLVDLQSQESVDIPLPTGITLGFPRWSPDGSRFAFTVTGDDGIELWIGESDRHGAHRLLGPTLNAVTGAPCAWMPDSRRMLCRTVPRSRRSADPLTMSNYTERGRQPLSAGSEPLNAGVVAQLIESQLILIDVTSRNRREIGVPAAIESVEPAPSGAYLLVQRMTPPYVDLGNGFSPGRVLEVWDIGGTTVRSFSGDGVTSATRAVHWRASQPATVAWAESSEDGDRVLLQSAPFVADPVALVRLEHSFAGMIWVDDAKSAIVRDFDPSQRSTSLWLVAAEANGGLPRRLGEHSVDAPHAGALMPATRLNIYGESVVMTHDNGIFLRGTVTSADDVRRTLDFVDLRSGERERLWISSEHHYESVVELLADDGSVILTRRESADEAPNYVIHDLDLASQRPVSRIRPPAESVLDARRIPLRYARTDGRELSAFLYVPADADPAQPLPVVMWAYPREFGTEASTLGVSTPERYLDARRAFRLFFLLRGYAVMDEVSMPIIGEPGQANDSFIEQIVDNAGSALAAAASTGFVDPHRAGIAGHSYGAFMVANLLAHSRLFEAGVAMSGAYNRTLTPFGFQTERRSLWDARELYLAMSPFLYSNQIEAPLLLVHGLRDDNAGTQPMQSQQFYNAIRYNGGMAELLLLPFEGHNYRARESVLQTAGAMLDWFDRHLKGARGSDGRLANTALDVR